MERAAGTQGLRFWALGRMVAPWGGQKEVGNRQASGQDQPGRTLTFNGSQGEPDLGEPHIAVLERGCWRNASQSKSLNIARCPTPSWRGSSTSDGTRCCGVQEFDEALSSSSHGLS